MSVTRLKTGRALMMAALLALTHVAIPLAGEVEDALRVFEDAAANPTSSDTPEEASWPGFSGEVRLATAYNYAHRQPASGETDRRGFSKLKTSLQLTFDHDLTKNWDLSVTGLGFWDSIYSIRGRDEYTEQVLDQYETEQELGEAYVRGRLTRALDFTAGRQILVWGKSDNIRVTDVLNPLDLREPGLTDIKDLRLAAASTRLDYGRGAWRLGAVALHEVRVDKNPVYGSDFYPLDAPLPPVQVPDSSPANTQWGLSLNGNFGGWDLSLYWADYYHHTPRFKAAQSPAEPVVELVHDRLKMFGSAFNITRGNWLFKAEAAYIEGFQFFYTGGKTFSRIDTLVGLEYYGWPETTLCLEAANRHLRDFDERLKMEPDNALENDPQAAPRVSHKMLNETLEMELLVSLYGTEAQNGGYQRFKIQYNFTDAWFATVGLIDYRKGDKTAFRNIGDCDRVFFELRFCF